jgi:hypothetical protein
LQTPSTEPKEVKGFFFPSPMVSSSKEREREAEDGICSREDRRKLGGE